MNNGSKGRCVTITPQASNKGITWLNRASGARRMWGPELWVLPIAEG